MSVVVFRHFPSCLPACLPRACAPATSPPSSWQPLSAPPYDSERRLIRCEARDHCSLHLHGTTSWVGGIGFAFVYSHKSTPGLVISTGNVGNYLFQVRHRWEGKGDNKGGGGGVSGAGGGVGLRGQVQCTAELTCQGRCCR